LNGHATNRVTLNPSNALTVELALDLSAATNALGGRVLANGWVSELIAERATFNAATNPCQFAGAYTVILPGADDDALGPAGHGFGTVKIDAGGIVNFSGTLADGTKTVQKVALSRQGEWPLYFSLYSGSGSILGRITAANQLEDDLHGTVVWFKPVQPTSKLYSTGFASNPTLTGSRYRPPTNTTDRVLMMTDGKLTFSQGNLAGSFTNRVMLTADNKILVPSGGLTVTLTLPTGLLNGTVTVPGSTRTLSFKGALHQKGNFGAGFFLGTNESGRVEMME
jgi:hypothetical protein